MGLNLIVVVKLLYHHLHALPPTRFKSSSSAISQNEQKRIRKTKRHKLREVCSGFSKEVLCNHRWPKKEWDLLICNVLLSTHKNKNKSGYLLC
jgi:hypothetical protein